MNKTLNILYIEDDPGTGRLVQKKLARLAFDVALASDGEKGMEKLQDAAFDLVLLDFWLPDQDGLSLLEKIQSLEQSPPVVVLTGSVDAEKAVSSLKAGAVDYLFKDARQDFIVQIQERFPSWIQSHAANTEQTVLIRDLKDYAQNVAHDLKNPLASLEALTNLLANDQLNEGQIARYSHAMVNTVEKMRNIVDELLLLATAKPQEIDFHEISMEEVIADALDRLELQVAGKDAQIELPAFFPLVIGYKSWVEEIWVNYLSNALKYGGMHPQITLGFDNWPGEQIRFWVKDEGPGISEEDQEILFQRFQRAGTDQAEGQGLGLSIVSRIIEKLGGEVGVESKPGGGSLFYFTLAKAASQTRDMTNLSKAS